MQVHGAQHGGPGPAVGPAGPAGHEDAAQPRPADTGSQPQWSLRGRTQRILHDVQVSRLYITEIVFFTVFS